MYMYILATLELSLSLLYFNDEKFRGEKERHKGEGGEKIERDPNDTITSS